MQTDKLIQKAADAVEELEAEPSVRHLHNTCLTTREAWSELLSVIALFGEAPREEVTTFIALIDRAILLAERIPDDQRLSSSVPVHKIVASIASRKTQLQTLLISNEPLVVEDLFTFDSATSNS